MKRKLKNVFNILGKFFLYYPISVFVILGMAFKYIFTGKLLGRVALILTYTGLVFSLVYKPIVAWIMLGAYLGFNVILCIWMIREEINATKFDYHTHHVNEQKEINPFFEGMSEKEAKHEYHKLMKKYHPDTAKGDLEMAQKVVTAYSSYCSSQEI